MNTISLRTLLVISSFFIAHQATSSPSETQRADQTQVMIESVFFDEQYESARSLANAGKRTESIAVYTALLKGHPKNADVLLGRGLVYAREEKRKEPESDLLEAIDQSSEYPELWLTLANMYSWSNQNDRAGDAYSQLIWLQPGNTNAYLSRARAYRKENKITLAINDLNIAKSLGAETSREEAYIQELETKTTHNANLPHPRGYHWSASLSLSSSDFTPGKAKWQDGSFSIRRYFERGSLALEILRAERFNKADEAFTVDSYVPLWERAYTNLRFQNSSSPALFPNHAWRAEIYQGIYTGWEISTSYDQLAFSSDPVKIYSLGVGKYIGNFYFRARHLIIPGDNGKSTSEKLQARYYFLGDADSYAELNASFGRDDDPLVIEQGQNNSYSLGAQVTHYPVNCLGYKLGFTYSSESNHFIERELSAGLYYRW